MNASNTYNNNKIEKEFSNKIKSKYIFGRFRFVIKDLMFWQGDVACSILKVFLLNLRPKACCCGWSDIKWSITFGVPWIYIWNNRFLTWTKIFFIVYTDGVFWLCICIFYFLEYFVKINALTSSKLALFSAKCIYIFIGNG